MVTLEHIQSLITECKLLGEAGLDNGISAKIPDLLVDVVSPPNDFIGIGGNPAIFVNSATYKYLASKHPSWIENRTIAIKSSLFKESTMNILGAIIHETGHAFNISANIPNTETNAYIFELEVLLKLIKDKSPLLMNCTEKDFKKYFSSRLPYYEKGVSQNEWLMSLVKFVSYRYQLKDISSPKTELKKFINHILFKKAATIFNLAGKNHDVKKEDVQEVNFERGL
jgi:hypothetical protein